MDAGQMFVGLRSPEAGDQLPFPHLRGEKPRGVDGVSLAIGAGPVQEPIGGAGLPWIDRITLAAGSLVAEFPGCARPRPWPEAERVVPRECPSDCRCGTDSTPRTGSAVRPGCSPACRSSPRQIRWP